MNAEASGIEIHPGGHPSRMALGRLLAGDCDAAAKTALEKHVSSCPHCSRVYENAKLDAEDFARRRPTLESLDAGNRRRAAGRPASEPSAGWGQRLRELFDRGFGMRPALAGLAILALGSVIWVLNGRAPAVNGGDGDLTAKGAAHFQAYLNGQPARGDTVSCAPNDTLQLFLLAEAPVHYAVLFRDDGGPLMPYMIGDNAGGKPLGTPRGEPLPHSLVLADGWAREILYCISSPQAFTLIEAEKAIAVGEGSAGGLRVQIIPLANRGP
jgi:hypothetical protein